MPNAAERRRALARLAWACAALVIAITTLSAYIRLSRAGLGCEPWPQCHAQRLEMPQEQLAALDSRAVLAARIAHRIVASAALLLVIVVLVRACNGSPTFPVQGRIAAAVLGIGLFLAILGRMAGDSRAAPVVMGNLLAGFAMFALTCRLALACGDSPSRNGVEPREKAAVLVAIALVAMQAGLGGALSASHEGSRCADSLMCNAHAASGILTALAGVVAGVATWRTGGFAARAVTFIATAQAVLGVAMANTGLPLAAGVTHNLSGALLAGGLVALLPVRNR